MDFFSDQEQARKLTRRLVFWYLVILFMISVLSSLILMLLIPIFHSASLNHYASFTDYLLTRVYIVDNWPFFIGVGSFVFIGAILSSWMKSRELAKGGAAVAEKLGATLVQPNTSNPLQKRALNIVQEMAVASSMPVPQLYLMSEETAINAFAAGLYPSDAVVTITRGALERLTRDQLQGVIAHEFSHILNGDMRLNLKLIMLLHGIEFIGAVGRFLTPRSARHHRLNRRPYVTKRGGTHAFIILVGVLLRILGWFGEIFAKILQAAVSRQREFLADASAVQFTRNPEGIAGALKVLAHDVVHNDAEEYSGSEIQQEDSQAFAHLFFAKALHSKFDWFATHPPLKDRIRRIDTQWDGKTLKGLPLQDLNEPFTEQQSIQDNESHPAEVLGFETQHNLALLLPVLMNLPQGGGQESSDSRQVAAAESLLNSLKEPLDAMAVVLALLLYRQASGNTETLINNWYNKIQPENRKVLDSIQGLKELVAVQLQSIQAIKGGNRLILVELSMPALKQLSQQQYRSFAQLLDSAVHFDNEVTIYESALLGIIHFHLRAALGLNETPQAIISSWKVVDLEIRIVFSYLIQQVSNSPTRQLDYDQACLQIGIETAPLMDASILTENAVQSAIQKLKGLVYSKKSELLKVIVSLVEKDGILTPTEEEIVLAFALSLEAPLPRFRLMAQLQESL